MTRQVDRNERSYRVRHAWPRLFQQAEPYPAFAMTNARRPSREELKTLIGKLVEEGTELRPAAIRKPPEFTAWTLGAELLADQIGGSFQTRMRQALDSGNEAYWARVREANAGRPGTAGQRTIYQWVIDAVIGLLRGPRYRCRRRNADEPRRQGCFGHLQRCACRGIHSAARW
jgi:hypothetical protein